PQLQELLKGAEKDETIKEALLKFSELQAEKEAQIQSQTPTVINPSNVPGILIPGNDRIVVPANSKVVVPENQAPIGIIPAFDESIPYNLRLERILAEKERREAQNEIFHEKTEEVIRGLLEGDWYYLWGPSGCGKSYTIKQIAKLIGIDMVDNGKITDKYSVMAYNDPQGRFRATQAFVALVYGKLLLLDELDNGNPDTQVVLNELYSGLLDALQKPNEKRYVTFAEDMTVPIHPNFRMISAGNTSGEGENDVFSSRGKMDESVQQRMTPKRFWYDNRVEQRIFGEYENWYNVFVNFRKACDSYASHQGLDTPVGIVTTRDAAAIMKYIKHNSKSVNQVLDEKFVQTKNNDYLQYISKKFQEYYHLSNIPNKDFDVANELGEVTEIEIAKKLILQCNRVSEKK
ncbi:MAG: AAA family ATPase, partial [Bacilli bacterium]|nr:AAA family ATPase [Bacilli bacterium]